MGLFLGLAARLGLGPTTRLVSQATPLIFFPLKAFLLFPLGQATGLLLGTQGLQLTAAADLV